MATMQELYQQYLLTQPGIGVSQNRYRELMSQARPFVNPYPAGTGLLAGATPAKPKVPAKTNSMGNYLTGGNEGGGGGGTGGGGMTTQFDTMTDTEKASFYANNPTFASITRAGQSLFGNTSLGLLQALFDPRFVDDQGLIALGVDPKAYQAAKESFRASEIKAMNEAAEAEAQQSAENAAAEAAIGSYGGGSFAEQQAINDAIAAQSAASEAAIGSYGGGSFAEQQAINDAIAAREADRNNWAAGIIAQVQADLTQRAAQQSADNAAAEGAIGSYGGGSFAEQQAINDAIAAAEAQSISDQNQGGDGGGYGGYSDSAGSSSFGEGQYAKGGKVIKSHLKGPDPKGPDEGYGALLGGEFVIKKSAVKKYGEGLLGMINDGKIPAKKMKSLLG